jgi:hypothetical protein
MAMLSRQQCDEPTAQEALTLASSVLQGTWEVDAYQRPGVHGVRAAGKQLLSALKPSRADYWRFKDSAQLAKACAALQALKPTPLGPRHDSALQLLRRAVCLFRRVLLRRPDNLYAAAPAAALLAGECVRALLALAAVVGKKPAQGSPEAERECADVAGDIVDFAVRELAFLQSVPKGEEGALRPQCSLKDGLGHLVRMLDCPLANISAVTQLRLGAMLTLPVRVRVEALVPLEGSVVASEARGEGPLRDEGVHKGKGTSFEAKPQAPVATDMEVEEEHVECSPPSPDADYRCDACDDFPLVNARWRCLVCEDWDLCEDCYARGDVTAGPHHYTHPMRRMLIPKRQGRGEAVAGEGQGMDESPPMPQPGDGDDDDDEEEEDDDDAMEVDETEEGSGAEKWGSKEQGLGAEGAEAGHEANAGSVDSVLSGLFSTLLQDLPSMVGAREPSLELDSQAVVSRMTLLVRLALTRAEAARERVPALLGVLVDSLRTVLCRVADKASPTEDGVGGSRSRASDAAVILSHALEYVMAALCVAIGRSPKRAAAGAPGAAPAATTSIALVCPGHGLPVEKRAFPHGGKNAGRMYLGCPLPQNQGRCQFFKWLKKNGAAGGGDTEAAEEPEEMLTQHLTEAMAQAKAVLRKAFTPTERGVRELVCELLDVHLQAARQQQPEAGASMATLGKDAMRSAWPWPMPADALGGLTAQLQNLSDLLEHPGPALLSSLLLLLALMRRTLGGPRLTPASEMVWQRRLCEVIEGRPSAPSTITPLKSAAKRLLRAICGNRAVYQRSRDFFVLSQCLAAAVDTVRTHTTDAGRPLRVLELRYTEQVKCLPPPPPPPSPFHVGGNHDFSLLTTVVAVCTLSPRAGEAEQRPVEPVQAGQGSAGQLAGAGGSRRDPHGHGRGAGRRGGGAHLRAVRPVPVAGRQAAGPVPGPAGDRPARLRGAPSQRQGAGGEEDPGGTGGEEGRGGAARQRR